MKNLPVFLMNVAVAVLSAFVIIMYLVHPFFQISVSYDLKASDFEESMEIEGIDLKEVLADKNIELSVSIDLQPTPMIEMLFHQDADATVDQLVASNVNGIIDKITNSLDPILDDVITTVVQTTVKTELKSQMKDHLLAANPNMTDEEMDALFERAGFTDDYIDSQTEKITNELFSDTATADSITSVTVNVAKDVFNDLKNSGEEEFADLEFSDENQQVVEDAVSSVLDVVSQEDGSINTDLYIYTMMLQLVKSMNEENDGNGDSGKIGTASPLSGVASLDEETSAPATPDEVMAELKTEVSNLILSYIPEDINQILSIVFNVCAGLLLLSIFAWAYLIIKIVVILLTRKSTLCKVKMPILLGWIPFLLFWIVPAIALKLLPNFMPNALPEAMMSMNISFYSSGIYAFIGAILLIAVWIVYKVLFKPKKVKKQKRR